MFKSPLLSVSLGALLVLTTINYGPLTRVEAQEQATARFFFETGHSLRGRFLQYWQQNGNLTQQGYPLTEAAQEVSAINGKTYLTQYFERAVFELHPENKPPYDVLLSHLGTILYREKYPNGTPVQWANDAPGSILLPETGKRLGSSFLKYWREWGGLPQFGYPISNEFQEKSALDGKTYQVQYFERAVFEYHPEYNGGAYEVLLSQLGRFRQEATHSLEPPNLPGPAFGDAQCCPQGNDQYIVWMESDARQGSTEVNSTYNIIGYDLKARKAITVTEAPGDQIAPAISGSMVVWFTGRANCTQCVPTGVYAKNLATGREYTVMEGAAPNEVYPEFFYSPAIDGMTVVWITWDGKVQRLMLKDLDTGKTQEIASIQDGNTSLRMPAINGEYIVWSEVYIPKGGQPMRPSSIVAYSRKTGMKKVVAGNNYDAANPSELAEYSLDGSRLAYIADDGSRLSIADLGTGQVSGYQMRGVYGPILRGDFLIFRTEPHYYTKQVYGINLLNASPPLPLLEGEEYKSGLTVAGDWLIWAQGEPPKIGIRSIYKAFSMGCAVISC
ncbi:MAG TPA: hypothetical protein VJ183_01205 [Chloroflexia bacterium]|nr:hypothetical protein [Chloroflexia bacterium]